MLADQACGLQDAHLRLTTRLLLDVAKADHGADEIAEQLTQWWSAKDAARIAHEIKAHLMRINSASHVPKTSDDPDFIPRMIEAGERRMTGP
ncbi:hypothetical protein C1X73_18940 [Pseudomonas sp. FW305-130]|nr:hypothetical protein C1X74_10775 [Pseudomonas sp. GW460-5]PNB56537.1 hypothetical protein C1X73_18940 [Pseudomonas sp. FW305-130]